MSDAPDTVKMTREEPHNETQTKSTFKERLQQFEEAIKGSMDFDKIRTLAFGGIPEHPGLRSVYWKILLSYLPSEQNIWQDTLTQKRKIYQDFVTELIIDPRKHQMQDDHPLSTSSNSQWHLFFKDKELLEEIDKDVKRTLPHLHFFNHDKSIGDTRHYEALKRILFIYAKLNPGIRYVQGMNEILGPIYYIFATDPVTDFKDNAEADAFFCFTNLMGEIRDNFCKTLDKSEVGITGLIKKLNNLLKAKDMELWFDFEQKGLNPQFYSFRWLTLLLSQEFDLPDVLRLWDSLFADPFRFEFFLYVCVAMLVCLRDQLLDGSFADNLKMIQHYPLQDIHVILAKAEEIRKPEYVQPPARPKPIVPEKEVAVVPAVKKTAASTSTTTGYVTATSKLKAFLFYAEPATTVAPPPKLKDHEEEDQTPLRPKERYLPVPPKPFDAEDTEADSHFTITQSTSKHSINDATFTIDDGEDDTELKPKSHPLA